MRGNKYEILMAMSTDFFSLLRHIRSSTYICGHGTKSENPKASKRGILVATARDVASISRSLGEHRESARSRKASRVASDLIRLCVHRYLDSPYNKATSCQTTVQSGKNMRLR